MRTSRKYKYKRGSLVLHRYKYSTEFSIGIINSSERLYKFDGKKYVMFKRLFKIKTDKIENICIDLLEKVSLGSESATYVCVLNKLPIKLEEDILKLMVFSS